MDSLVVGDFACGRQQVYLRGARELKASELKTTESQEQIALFQWSAIMEFKYPELKLMHSIPNGSYKSPAAAAKFKLEGLKSGVSDIFLPVARNTYHGLYIELKVKGGKLSDNQQWWISETTKQGYLSVVCWTWEAAKDVIEKYLK